MGTTSLLVGLFALTTKHPQAKVRNSDADVIRAVIEHQSVDIKGRSVNDRSARKEVFVLHPQLLSRSRSSVPEIIDEIIREREEKDRPTLGMLRFWQADIFAAEATFRPPAVRPLRELELGPRVFVGEIRSWQEMYGTRALRGSSGRFAGGRGSVSAPGYAADGRYAGVELTTIAFIHPVFERYLLRREGDRWKIVASTMTMAL